MMKNARNFVKQCLDGKSCDNFKNYFISKSTNIQREQAAKLPSIKLEFGKKSFLFQGAKVCNNHPLEMRESASKYSRLQEKTKCSF